MKYGPISPVISCRRGLTVGGVRGLEGLVGVQVERTVEILFSRLFLSF